MDIETSPNGVDHLMIKGKCATCGKGHEDWPDRGGSLPAMTQSELDKLIMNALLALGGDVTDDVYDATIRAVIENQERN